MQSSKLPASRLWIAGVSTALILVSCEGEPMKDQAANSNQAMVQEEAKTKAEADKKVQGQAAPQAYRQSGPVIDIAPPASPIAGAFQAPSIPGEGEKYI